MTHNYKLQVISMDAIVFENLLITLITFLLIMPLLNSTSLPVNLGKGGKGYNPTHQHNNLGAITYNILHASAIQIRLLRGLLRGRSDA